MRVAAHPATFPIVVAVAVTLVAVWLGVAAWRTWRHPRPGPWAPPPGGRR